MGLVGLVGIGGVFDFRGHFWFFIFRAGIYSFMKGEERWNIDVYLPVGI